MGDNELIVFRVLLIVGAAIWIFGSFYTTSQFLKALIFERGNRSFGSLPFVVVNAMWGITKVLLALIFVVATFWNTNAMVIRIASYSLAGSIILHGIFYNYLGFAIRTAKARK